MSEPNKTNPKDELTALIIDLKLAVTDTDVEKYLSALSDEEVQLLIPSFKDVKNYQDNLLRKLEEVDPVQAARIEEEYENSFNALEHDFLKKLEDVQSQFDAKADANMTGEQKEQKELFEKEEEALNATEKAFNHLQEMSDL